MNKPVYSNLAILDLRKMLMYEIQYDYIKPNFGDYAQLASEICLWRYCGRCGKKFNTSVYNQERVLHVGKKSNWINETRIKRKNYERKCCIGI